MTEILIAAGVLVLGIGGFIFVDALRRPGDERDPEQPHNVERIRPQSEAKAAGGRHDQLSEKDAAEAAELVAFVEEISTGEFPNLAFDIDPLGAPIPDGYRIAEAAEFNGVASDWFASFAWPSSPAPTVSLSSVQVSEPDPFELESFTRDWTRADVDRMVAEEKAGAK